MAARGYVARAPFFCAWRVLFATGVRGQMDDGWQCHRGWPASQAPLATHMCVCVCVCARACSPMPPESAYVITCLCAQPQGRCRHHLQYTYLILLYYCLLVTYSNTVLFRCDIRGSRIIPTPSSRTCWAWAHGPLDAARHGWCRFRGRTRRCCVAGASWADSPMDDSGFLSLAPPPPQCAGPSLEFAGACHR